MSHWRCGLAGGYGRVMLGLDGGCCAVGGDGRGGSLGYGIGALSPCLLRRGFPLAAVDGASRLALNVNAFDRRGHLQWSARAGGRVQSIGRGNSWSRSGSGHGWGGG